MGDMIITTIIIVEWVVLLRKSIVGLRGMIQLGVKFPREDVIIEHELCVILR